ncbi:LOW QUALITY PROTEIN: hypothetical protein V2J09_002532 [Rumex salicifolius]
MQILYFCYAFFIFGIKLRNEFINSLPRLFLSSLTSQSPPIWLLIVVAHRRPPSSVTDRRLLAEVLSISSRHPFVTSPPDIPLSLPPISSLVADCCRSSSRHIKKSKPGEKE